MKTITLGSIGLLALIFAFGLCLLACGNSSPRVAELDPLERYIDTQMNVVCYTNHRSVSCVEIPKLAELPKPQD
jgi:hypothetical protein